MYECHCSSKRHDLLAYSKKKHSELGQTDHSMYCACSINAPDASILEKGEALVWWIWKLLSWVRVERPLHNKSHDLLRHLSCNSCWLKNHMSRRELCWSVQTIFLLTKYGKWEERGRANGSPLYPLPTYIELFWQ